MISPEMQAKVARIQELQDEATKDPEAYFQWRLVQRAAYDRDSIRAAYEEEGEAIGFKKGRAEGLKEGEAIGIKKGKARGLEKGRAEGMAEGLEIGRAEGMAEGVANALRNAVPGMAKAGHSIESIADILKLSVEEISKYL